MYVNFGLLQEEGIDVVDENLEKALALDDKFAMALAVRGWREMLFGDGIEEGCHFWLRALEADPDEPFANLGLIATYVYAGKTALAAPYLRRLQSVDPLTFATLWSDGAVHYVSGDFGSAAAAWKRAHEMEPDNPLGHFYYSMANAAAGRNDEALLILDDIQSADPDNAAFKMCRMFAHGLRADRDGLLSEVTPDLQKTAMRDLEWSLYFADAFAMVGEKNEALMWIENAVARGFYNYPMLAELDPFLKNIRGEKRFKDLMVKVKKEWEEFEV